LKDVS